MSQPISWCTYFLSPSTSRYESALLLIVGKYDSEQDGWCVSERVNRHIHDASPFKPLEDPRSDYHVCGKELGERGSASRVAWSVLTVGEWWPFSHIHDHNALTQRVGDSPHIHDHTALTRRQKSEAPPLSGGGSISPYGLTAWVHSL